MLRRLVIAAVVLVGLAAAALVAVATLGCGPLTQRTLARLSAEAELDLRCRRASGNLLTGRVLLEDFRLEARGPGEHPGLVGEAARVEVQLDPWSLFGERYRARSLVFHGAQGEMMQAPWPPPGEDALRGPARFRAERLRFVDSALKLLLPRPDGPFHAATLEVHDGEALDVRSEWLLHDLLYRSTATGELLDKPLEVSRKEEGGELEVRWWIAMATVDLLEVFGIHDAVPWGREGPRVSLDVHSRWHRDAPDSIATRVDIQPAKDQRSGASEGESALMAFGREAAAMLGRAAGPVHLTGEVSRPGLEAGRTMHALRLGEVLDIR